MMYVDNRGVVHFKQRPGRGRSFGNRKYTACEGPFGPDKSIMYATWQLTDLPRRSPAFVTCVICLARRFRGA